MFNVIFVSDFAHSATVAGIRPMPNSTIVNCEFTILHRPRRPAIIDRGAQPKERARELARVRNDNLKRDLIQVPLTNASLPLT